MTPLSSTDPNAIVSAARCFESCVPGSAQAALRSYLLAQSANIATPPCITPAAPLNLRSSALPAGVDPNTNIRVSWNTPKNSGSLITGYIVSWGTTQGGPYPNSSGVIGAGNHSYTISGLTSATTYYIVVQSFSFTGCTSANSSEFSTSTSGGNALLNSLVSYWPIDGATSLTADLQDSNTLTLAGGTIIPVGGPFAGTGYLDSSGNAVLSLAATPVNMRLGTGKSFTYQIWFNPTVAGSQTNLGGIAGDLDGVSNSWVIEFGSGAPAQIYFVVYCTDNNQFFYHENWPSPGWHHLIIGYDSANKQSFYQLDGGTRQFTATTADVNSVSVPFYIGKNGNFGVFYTGGMAQSAFWSRVLSTSDVATLYNGGAGLPYSQFTH